MATGVETSQAHRVRSGKFAPPLVHRAIGDYRNALDEARRHGEALLGAVSRAGEAASKLQPFVNEPIPAIEWRSGVLNLYGPPVAEWIAGQDDLVRQVKAGLQA